MRLLFQMPWGLPRGFLFLMHSVGHLPGNSEIDLPLNYADYYFLEGLLRYQKVMGRSR